MNSQELQQLLGQPEGVKIYFKQKLHKIYHPEEQYRKTQKDEFIRDVLCLTNGNVGTADETGYLIVGVGDSLNDDGTRDLFDVKRTLTPKQILQRVNSACYPPIPQIECETVELYGKNIFVVSIPPTPYLHKTLRELVTSKKSRYQAGTVFIKYNREILSATPEECELILREKERLFSAQKFDVKYNNSLGNRVVELVGREPQLKSLRELFQQQHQRGIVAISGPDGVGKTELASYYGQPNSREVCWINATEGDVGIQLVRFARSFFSLNPPEGADNLSQLKFCWQNWPTPPEGVLIVVDSVTDYQQQVKPYLPPESSLFKVLLVMRECLDPSLLCLQLDELQPKAALKLLEWLTQDADRTRQELESAKKICQWVGYLPLGLELVGSYLNNQRGLAIATLLSLLEEKRQKYIALEEKDTTLSGHWRLAAAFDLSWEKLKKNERELGYLLSLFAEADIPVSVVKLAYSKLFPSEEEEIYLDKLEEARANLLSFHLLKPAGEESDRLHPLIQKLFREKREQIAQFNNINQGFVAAMATVAKLIPDSLTRQEIPTITPLIPHLAKVAKDKDLMDLLSDEDLVWPGACLGQFYQSQGLYNKAKVWFEQCLSVTQARFGLDHPAVATSLHNLAKFYHSQGDYSEAECLYMQALNLQKSLLGENTCDVAVISNNIGNFYSAQGRYKEAEILLFQALKIYKNLGEENHANVATSLNNLATLYNFQGRHSEAESLFKQALELEKSLRGENHLAVATSLNNLASVYSSQGRYSEAEALFVKALELEKSLRGEEHSAVATSLNNLALLYHSQGRYSEAEPLYQQALALHKLLLGENHSDVATSMNNLAALYRIQRRYSEAEPLYLQALSIWKGLLGEDHPNVAISLNNLASFYQSQGRYSEAEPLLLQALELNKRLLGQEHADVATSLNNLALLYSSQGRYSEAEPFYMQALELRTNLLGENHPDVAISLNNMAALYRAQGSYTKAESLYLQALELRKRSLGENHPNVAQSLNNLAVLYSSQERYSDAEPLLQQALEVNKRLLGEDHPDVATSLNNMALFYCSQGSYKEAEPLFVQALEIFERQLGSEHPQTVSCRENLSVIRDRINSTERNLPQSNGGSHKGKSNKKGKGFWNMWKP